MFTRSSLPLLLVAFVVAAHVYHAQADLPIHCIHSQALGKWHLNLGLMDGDRSLSCGHSQPDSNIQHFTTYSYTLKTKSSYTVELRHPNLVFVEDHAEPQGTWTMIYDEGVEIKVHGKIFFAFFAYEPKSPESLASNKVEFYTSLCDRTMVGWYHNMDASKWGCFQAYKDGQKPWLPPQLANKKGHQDHLDADAVVAPVGMLEIESNDALFNADTSTSESFVPSAAFVEAINTDKSKFWSARLPAEFEGLSLQELDSMIGARSHGKVGLQYLAARSVLGSASLDYSAMFYTSKDKRMMLDNDLPDAFDWRDVRSPHPLGSQSGEDYSTPVRSQGRCGSCYSFGVVAAAEMRLRVLTKNADKTILSPQSVVSCSRQNEGCNGGYPFLVGKHGYEFGFVSEDCFPYDVGAACSAQCSNPKRYFAKSYGYIGGYYGGCNELAMMKEIYSKGPIAAAIQAPRSLYYYKTGVFHGPHPKREPGWEQTNHAIAIVGWGIDKTYNPPVKYWIVRNSWSERFGDKGYFKVARGVDEIGIESMAVTVDLKPVDTDD